MLTSLELYEKVEILRIQKGIKVADLNRLAGISHATLPSWKKRATMPRLEVLDGLCTALGISLATLLFDVDENKLSVEELDLLATWRKLTIEQQRAIVTMMKAMIKDQGAN